MVADGAKSLSLETPVHPMTSPTEISTVQLASVRLLHVTFVLGLLGLVLSRV